MRNAILLLAIGTLLAFTERGALGTGDHGGHDHGAAEALLSLDAIRSARCEHEIPAYTCDACRYEVGVVKLDPSLIKKGADGQGLVRVEAAALHRAGLSLEVTGEIVLDDNRTVHLTPPVPGIVSGVFVDVGSRVREGDRLLEMRSVEAGEALAAHRRSRTLADLARKNLEREEELFERKVSAEVDLIEARMRYAECEADGAAAEARLRAFGLSERDIAGAEAGSGTEARGALPLRAPMGGVVVHKHATIGERIEPGAEILLLADLSTVWVWLDIYAQDLRDLAALGSGARVPVEVETDAFAGRVFTGALDHIGAVMDETTRTVKARAVVANPE
ncbi:MAG: efflux RND transporter periplasmic adaptor subunit, partial [Candidatus Eisenbacteria bacterium]